VCVFVWCNKRENTFKTAVKMCEMTFAQKVQPVGF